ncbi:hypothetical protein PIB30_084672 [Stylosanthes scabra]|uniref:Uncharacterized protein n=1 Tax=Stylosanthes scabra TaxID=79078 RepID=A0ABU6VWB1_9FABA|nr:hypothetical protein [Stylosanthes scabra]
MISKTYLFFYTLFLFQLCSHHVLMTRELSEEYKVPRHDANVYEELGDSRTGEIEYYPVQIEPIRPIPPMDPYPSPPQPPFPPEQDPPPRPRGHNILHHPLSMQYIIVYKVPTHNNAKEQDYHPTKKYDPYPPHRRFVYPSEKEQDPYPDSFEDGHN